ncbi:hypothetical protein PP175_27005 (plasmid) [Aneurinibacillus sp. Ricciae_BoGa-3]|uniref:hypothetical protein n=1 Tax=Aneurinibacillus sp. Ricciae_BoGa-3 TaxID=3022697 RepID=UPI002341272F|nr:hypothetical protein [Aneurinibacillus sp. Ricciae_BoGa-3]WCK57688.1 hypothetical protein PP175_27005 [Aneurinibacillus sp. Ricciae_BoGa-3]
MMRKILKNKKGFVSIETIIATTCALMVVLLSIGFFTWLFPRVMLQIETHDLAQKAKIQGGLTDATSEPVNSDVEQFKNRLAQMGYDKNQVNVIATTKPGNLNAMGVTPLHDNGTNYIKRDSKELIQLTIQVPANNSIKAPMSFFGLNQNLVDNKYTIVESVMSERW